MYKKVNMKYAYRLLGFSPLVIVSTMDKKGNPNLMTAAWCTLLQSDPCRIMMRIGERHKSFKNIMAAGEFGLNVVDSKLIKLSYDVGTVSGSEIDKIKEFNIKLKKSKKIKAPVLDNAPAIIECKLTNRKLIKEYGIITGKAVYACALDGILKNKVWNLSHQRGKIVHHLGSYNFSVSGKTVKI